MFRQDIDFESLEPVSEKPTTKAAVSRFPKEKSVSPVPQRRPQSTVTTSTPAASKAKSSQNESLNPMVFYEAFQHITESIFEKLDTKSLKNYRKVSKLWQNCIDEQNILWKKISNVIGGKNAFRLACKKDHSKMALLLIQKPAEFNIDQGRCSL